MPEGIGRDKVNGPYVELLVSMTRFFSLVGVIRIVARD